MIDFEFYKELYHKENDRRHLVMNSLNIPIIVITGLITAIYFFASTFDYNSDYINTKIFIILISISMLSTLIAFIFMVKAFSNFTKGYEYTGIPFVQELYDWKLDLDTHFLKYGKAKIDSEKHFSEFLTKNLVKHIDHNTNVNDKKLGYIFKSKRYLIIALFFMILTLVFYSMNYFKKTSESQQTTIVKDKSVENELIILNNRIDSLTLEINHLKNERRRREFSTSTSTTSSR